jgi:Protein of unknown function (DUF3168)
MPNSTAMLAVQATIFSTLSVPAVTNLAAVYDSVPEGRSYPYVEIGEIEETLSNVFGKNGRALIVSIHIFSDQDGYKEAELILEQLNILLDDTLLPNPAGWRTNQSEYAIGTAQKEFDTVEIRHVIARYHIDVTQT